MSPKPGAVARENREGIRPTLLVPGKTIERDLKISEAHWYSIALRSPQFLHITAEQKGVDLVVTFLDQNDKVLIEIDSPNGSYGPESLSFETPSDQVYQVKINAPGEKAKGAYSITAEIHPTASPNDQSRIDAERNFRAARQHHKENTRASLTLAIPEYTAAADDWQKAKDEYSEAMARVNLGRAYWALGNNEAAFDQYLKALSLQQANGDHRSEAATLDVIGMSYAATENYRKSVEYLHQALAISRALPDRPNETSLLKNLGGVYQALSNSYYYEALSPAERADYWFRVGSRYSDDDKYDEAISSLRKALEFDPTSSLYLTALVSDFKLAGKFSEGLDFVNQWRAKGIENDVVQELLMDLNYAMAADLESKGSAAEAIKYYQSALQTDRFRQGRSPVVEFTESYSVLNRFDPVSGALDLDLRFESGQAKGAAFNEDLAAIQQDIAVYNYSVAALQQAAHENLGSFGIDPEPLIKGLEEKAAKTKSTGNPTLYADVLTDQAATYAMLAELIDDGVNDYASTAANKSELKNKWREAALKVYGDALAIRRQVNDRYGEASLLNDLGVLSFAMGKNADADKYYQQALNTFRSLDDKGGITRVLTNLGANAMTQKRTDEARRYLNQALEFSRATGNQKIELAVLQYLASLYVLDGRNDEAVKSIQAALVLSRELKEIGREARLLITLGDIYATLNRTEESLARYQEALEIGGDREDNSLKWFAFRAIGDLNVTLKQPKEAARNYRRAMEAKGSRLGERESGALSYNVGLIYHSLNQDDKAKESYRLAALHKQSEKDARGELRSRLKKASLGIGTDDSGGALEDYEKALELAKQLADSTAITQALIGLGGAYYLRNEFQKSIGFYREGLQRLTDTSGIRANVLLGLAASYEAFNLHTEAINHLNEALALTTQAKAQPETAAILNNLGLNFTYLGEYQKAISFYDRAMVLRQKLQDQRGEALTLNNLAFCYSQMNQFSKALDFYQRALTIERKLSDRIAEGRTLGNLAELEAGASQFENALKHGEEALALVRVTKDRGGEGAVLYKLGLIRLGQGQYEQATDLFTQSWTVFQALNTTARKGLALNGLMLSWKGLGQTDRAIFYGKQAVNAYQRVRANLRSLDLRQSFLRSKEDTYRTLASLLISQDRLPEAEAVLDLLKEEEFSQLIRRGDSSNNLPYSDAETAALKTIDELARIGLARRELLDKQIKQALEPFETKELNRLEDMIKTANAELRRTFETLTASEVTTGSRVAEIQKEQSLMRALRELGPGTVALYTVIGGGSENSKEKIRSGWIVLVTPDFRKAYPIDVTNLEQTVIAFREALRDDKNDPRSISEQLYHKLFLQVSDKQKNTLAADLDTYLEKQEQPTLMWSLDGALRYVPIAALYDGRQYLVERYRNVVFNTASLDSLKDSGSNQWTVLGLGVSEAREEQGKTFPALTGAERELRAIVHQQDAKPGEGILPGVIKLNKDFNQTSMIDGLRAGYPLVHIASHFSFNVANPSESFLLLGQDHLSVGVLQDLSNPFERVELLTLSACDTAIGSANGKEVEGFAYTAQSLGAKAVIASLWPVSDQGTDALMTRFYTLRRDNPQMPKGEALRQAQLSMLRGVASRQPSQAKEAQLPPTKRAEVIGAKERTEQPLFQADPQRPFAHPYYWAPFILIGNWK